MLELNCPARPEIQEPPDPRTGADRNDGHSIGAREISRSRVLRSALVTIVVDALESHQSRADFERMATISRAAEAPSIHANLAVKHDG